MTGRMGNRRTEEVTGNRRTEEVTGNRRTETITLGQYYYTSSTSPVNPWLPDKVSRYWGTPRKGVGSITIAPFSSILGHSAETITSRSDHLEPIVQLRRCAVTVRVVDSSKGKWALLITNHGSGPVILPIGSPVGVVPGLEVSSHHSTVWNPEMILGETCGTSLISNITETVANDVTTKLVPI
jgi:hypothetical protein